MRSNQITDYEKELVNFKQVSPSRLAEFNKRWKKHMLTNAGFKTFADNIAGVRWTTNMFKTPDGYVWVNGLMIECKKFSNHFVAVFFPGNHYDPEKAVETLDRSIGVLVSPRLKLNEVDKVFLYLLRKFGEFTAEKRQTILVPTVSS